MATIRARPSVRVVTPEQYNKLVDRLVECDIEYLEAVAQLEAIKPVRERKKEGIDQELHSRTWLRELEAAVEKAKRKKSALMDYVAKMRLTEKERHDDTEASTWSTK